MSDIQKLQKNIEELAVSWGEALKIGDHRNANKQNSAITKIAKRFRKDKKLGEAVLVPLLGHLNPSVRLMASVQALDQEIQIRESEDILIKIANDPTNHVVGLMAQINLSEWNKKKRVTSNQKDEPGD
jgi:hypothetical protein